MKLPHLFQQRGSGIISALVSLAIVSLVAVVVGWSITQNLKVRKAIQGRDSFIRYNDIIRAAFTLDLGILLKSAGWCSSLSDLLITADVNNPYVFATSPVNDFGEKAVAFPRLANVAAVNNFLGRTYVGNSEHESAKSLCATQVLNENLSLTGSTEFAFCIRLQTGSVGENRFPAFAVVRYQMRDFYLQTPVTCTAFNAATARGGLVYYTIYWVTNTGTKTSDLQFNRYTGSKYAPVE